MTTREGPTITGFLTDGSLLSVCVALGDLSSSRVRLTDEQGREVTRGNESSHWDVLPETADSAAIARAVSGKTTGLVRLDDLGLVVAPIIADRSPIGAIVMDAPPRGERPAHFEQTERVALGLAMTAGQFCADELALRRRHAEQNVLYRLSSLLVGSTDLESTFNIALRSAAELFGADAGCLYTVEDRRRGTLRLSAQLGLSDELAERLDVLPSDEIVDREALDGEVVLVEDLLAETRALHLEAIAAEGFRGMVSFGITYRERRIGLIRLYAKRRLSGDHSSVALLRAISEQVAAAAAAAESIERAREHRQLKRQLKLAGDVQRRMLPREAPVMKGLDFAARYEASYELGGDFYDTLTIRKMPGVVIGDVVGKGVPAALLMSSTRAFFRAHLRREPAIADAMGRVNRALVRDTLESEFVTALAMVFDPHTRTLHFCSAGHDAPLIARTGNGGERSVEPLDLAGADGMVLGIDKSQEYAGAAVALDPGDVVVAFTDGTHEAMDFEGQKFGPERLKRVIADILRDRPNATSKEIVDHALWEIRRFAGLARASDDITIVALRVLPEG